MKNITIKKVFGGVLIASPFITFLVFGYYANQLVAAVMSVVTGFAILGAVVFGIYLLMDDI